VYDPAVFSLIHVDTDNATAQALIDHWGQYNPTFPILTQCASLLQSWGEGYIPHTTILDPQGVVRGNWVGWSDAFGQQMHETIAAWSNPTGLYLDQVELLFDSDSDGVPEPGEAISLAVHLENRAEWVVDGVTGQLACDTEGVIVTTSQANWPAFQPGEIHAAQQTFEITLAADLPAAMDLEFHLQLGSDHGTAQAVFPLAVGLRVEYWTHDAEAQAEEWSHSSTAGWADAWHLSTEDSQSPTHAWKAGSTGTGNYPNHADCRLVGPPLELRDWSRLQFRHRMNAETSAAFPDSAYDGGIVEISTDDGASWSQLVPLGGHDKAFRALAGNGNPASHNFPGQTPCYSGAFDWEDAAFDLAAYNGQTVRFAFHFGSDNGGAQEGWYVDDLRLAAPEPATHSDPAGRPFRLDLAVHPNPFNPDTRVSWTQTRPGLVRLVLYDLAGRQVRELVHGHRAAGFHELRLDGAGLASGVYLLRLETDETTQGCKVLLVK
jgi:hypothetical protein